jgi:hypothetical protein
VVKDSNKEKEPINIKGMISEPSKEVDKIENDGDD